MFVKVFKTTTHNAGDVALDDLISADPDGDGDIAYTPRSPVVGGDSPYAIAVTGSLPPGPTLGDYTDTDSGLTLYGVLHGTPTAAGNFNFTVASHAYVPTIAGGVAPTPTYALVVEPLGGGSGTVTTCTVPVPGARNCV